MEVAIVLGVIALGLLIAAIFFYRKSSWLTEASPVDLTAAAAAAGRLVRLSGTVTAGPAGPARGPLSEQEAPWWSFRIEEEWFEPRRGTQGSGRGRRRRRTLEREQSAQPFAIVDGQTRAETTVLVGGMDVEVDGATQSVNQRDHGSMLGRLRITVGGSGLVGGGRSYVQREWVLPEGARVEAVGTLSRQEDGTLSLVRGERGGLLVTTRTIDAVMQRNRLLALGLGALGIAAAVAAAIVATS